MKLPISNLLSLFCFCVLTGTVQAQTTVAQAPCPGAVTRNIKVNIATQVEPAIAAALHSLESLEHITAISSLEKLSALPSLPSVAHIDIDPAVHLHLGTLIDPNITIVGQPDPGAQSAFAFTKTKKIDRTFKVDRTDKLSLENQFGKVEVQTWGKNEIVVEVTVVARAASEAKAQEILDKINIRVNDDRDNDLVAFVTEREPMQIRSSSEKAFEINYLVKMPKGNPLKVSNKYGAVQVPDFDGPTEFELQYGKLTTGSLNNTKNKMTVTYSGAECQLAYVKGGDLTFKYSNLRLLGADDINTYTAYSNITIDKVDVLNMESRYDSKFQIGSVGQIIGNGSYSGIKIGSLKESGNLSMKYCSGFEISNVASGFKKLDLTGGYTGMAVGFADNSAFNFEVDTHYGSLRLNQDLANFSFKEVRNTSSSYKGKYGKSAPKGTVNVTSKYGSIAFR